MALTHDEIRDLRHGDRVLVRNAATNEDDTMVVVSEALPRHTLFESDNGTEYTTYWAIGLRVEGESDESTHCNDLEVLEDIMWNSILEKLPSKPFHVDGDMANIVADWLEENGHLEPAELLRKTWSIPDG